MSRSRATLEGPGRGSPGQPVPGDGIVLPLHCQCRARSGPGRARDDGQVLLCEVRGVDILEGGHDGQAIFATTAVGGDDDGRRAGRPSREGAAACSMRNTKRLEKTCTDPSAAPEQKLATEMRGRRTHQSVLGDEYHAGRLGCPLLKRCDGCLHL